MGFGELEKLSQPMRQNEKGVVWGYPHKVERRRTVVTRETHPRLLSKLM